MKSMRMDAIEAEEHILDKIASKHSVDIDEVREACMSRRRHVRRVREHRYLVLGRSQDGRYLASIVHRGEGTTFWLITARDMNREERRTYEQHAQKGS